MDVRRRYVFRGRVQGVGFRHTTSVAARDFAVTGWVRNLPDGTVELRAAGTSAEVDAFVKRIEAEFEGHIRGCDVAEDDSGETWSGFAVRR